MKPSNNHEVSNLLSASILSADFAYLADDIKKAIDAGIHHIHFDVMDHHFVPNLSFGACICDAIRKAGITIPIDVHLMVQHPEHYIEPFANAGANWITFHPSASDDVIKTIEKITASGMQAGLAFNPDETVIIEDAVLAQLRMILLMSVFPGFGGQAFIPATLEKIKATQQQYQLKAKNIYLGVDGGIKTDNIGATAQAGADFFVVGSGLFHSNDYNHTISRVQEILGELNTF